MEAIRLECLKLAREFVRDEDPEALINVAGMFFEFVTSGKSERPVFAMDIEPHTTQSCVQDKS